MHKVLILAAMMLAVGTHSKAAPDTLVLISGGVFKNTKSNYHKKSILVPSFYIGKYEVTQKEWVAVMGSNPSEFKGDGLPVEMVNWYDCVDYCNKRSLKEGLRPYYNINRNKKDPNNTRKDDVVKWTITINPRANGYRLPTEVEWEYAAGGGAISKGYNYSGGNDVNQVAWYYRNAGDKPITGAWLWPAIQQNHNQTKPVGGRKPNELGLYDMSGNVREWCWDWYGDLKTGGAALNGNSSGSERTSRGGGWIGIALPCESSFRGVLIANYKTSDQGFRVCRNR